MYKYSIEIAQYIPYDTVYDTWNNKQVFIGNLQDCIKYINGNNKYQLNYSKLILKKITKLEYIPENRYYMGIIPLDDWRLCDIPNIRRNAKLLTN